MPDKDPCAWLEGPAEKYCTSDSPGSKGGGPNGNVMEGAVDSVQDLAAELLNTLQKLVAPGETWAPQNADSALYAPFLWLGQHLAVAVFVCVVAVCALTAWQGAPRLRQLGATTGWTLAAVAGMASVPGVVMLLNKAVSNAFTAAFNSNESTLFKVIQQDMKTGADSDNPLAILLIISALVVALAFAALVFITRQLGILAFVCMAPLVLASLARGGDTTAVKQWAQRLLGLMFAPFALLLVAPFVEFAKGSLVVDAVLLVAADALMLRMIFHGVPYFGPKIAGAARDLVERNTTNPAARSVVRAGAPEIYEQENTPRGHRTVPTPGRALHQDRGVLFAAYGIDKRQRPGRLTADSAAAQVRDRATHSAKVAQARKEARAAVQAPGGARAAHRSTASPVPPARRAAERSSNT